MKRRRASRTARACASKAAVRSTTQISLKSSFGSARIASTTWRPTKPWAPVMTIFGMPADEVPADEVPADG